MRIIVFIIVLAIIASPFIYAKYVANRPDGPPTTDTVSSSFQTQQQKIAFLKRYAKCPSPVLATEFHIQYLNNSGGGVPGPSAWNVRFAVKVPPSSVNAWTRGCRPVPESEIDASWWADLPLHPSMWTRQSAPQYFQRPDTSTYLAVYEHEGIILKRIFAQ